MTKHLKTTEINNLVSSRMSNRGDVSHRQSLMSGRGGRTSIEIGPVQFQKILNDLVDSVRVDDWRNIPIVVKESIGAMVNVFDTLKKFIIALEHRINQTNISVDLKFEESNKLIS